MSNIQSLIRQLLEDWETHLQFHGCLEVPNSRLPKYDLNNDIHDLFTKDRWTTGRSQHTDKFYHRMKPALRLASRLLTEDSTLTWFRHVAFGELKQKPSGQCYLEFTRHEDSEQARSEIRHDLNELAKVLTLMFIPRGHNKIGRYGITYDHRRQAPWYRDYHSSDWPADLGTGRSNGRARPLSALHSDFQKFFEEKYSTASRSQKYRVQYMFAATLVHEVAHAYGFWRQFFHAEPLWGKNDKKAELGFSWEMEALGRIINPMRGSIANCTALVSIEMEKYRGIWDRDRILEKLIDQRNVEYKRVVEGRAAEQLLDPLNYHGSQWFDTNDSGDSSMVCVVQAVPVRWLAQWFTEAFWERRANEWRRDGWYTPPKIDTTFVLIYQRDGAGNASIHRPLNPHDADDFHELMMRRQEQEGW